MVSRVLAALAAVGVIAGALMESGLPGPVSQWMFIVLGCLFPVLGRLLTTRRPAVPYGWLLLGTALALGLGTFGVGLAVRAPWLGWLVAPLSALFAVFYGLTWVFVPLMFPDGRLPSPRWRPVAWLAAVAIAVQSVALALVPELPYGGHNPLAFPGSGLMHWVASFAQLIVLVLALVVLGGLVGRWRRSKAAERGQYGWMVAGAVAGLVGWVMLLAFQFGALALGLLGVLSVLGALPVAIGVAIVRYRLLDIRVGRRGSRLHIVVGVRPTVGEMLTTLGTALEDAPEPVEQLGRLAAAVRSGLNVRWAAVALADGTRVVSGPEEGQAELTVPVTGGLGTIECGPGHYGPLSEEDGRLLEALAVPAGLAIQSAGLATRLVNAQEAERRRIERNIHDGVQQQLVALIAGLEVARATGGGVDQLAHLRDQARQTLQDLRELAAGIHPSALGQGGLVEAVEERCALLPVPTTVTASAGLRARRFPDEVEGALYFTVSEAVANALKHARAAKIEVRLAHDGGRLRVSVADDGRGFDTGAAPLAALADRLDALGGGLKIDSGAGKGTRVEAWVDA
ncbi:sensor histidine kinase [Nonomuraea sp. NPDC050536]|uniref:sensor histidine kinase n=1 Tax=Nonomuraea sp. NPDC050536 TaxID=3364366 RepID=UPI0037C8A339